MPAQDNVEHVDNAQGLLLVVDFRLKGAALGVPNVIAKL